MEIGFDRIEPNLNVKLDSICSLKLPNGKRVMLRAFEYSITIRKKGHIYQGMIFYLNTRVD